MLNNQAKVVMGTVAAAVFALGTSAACACPHGEHKGDCKDGQCKHKKRDIVKALSLEGTRAEQVKEIQKRYRAERKALKAQLKALREAQRGELAQLLSEEELAKVDAMMAERSHYKGGKHHGFGAHDGPQPKQCKGKKHKENHHGH